MGRKPVLGLAGLLLAGVTLTGCENTDWCCWGKKTPPPPPRMVDGAPKAPPRMPMDSVDSKARTGGDKEQSVMPDERPSGFGRDSALPTGLDKRSGLVEESDVTPPRPPQRVAPKDLEDPLPKLDEPAKKPVMVPEKTGGPKIAPPVNSTEDDLLPLGEPPAPPKPFGGDSPTKSSSNKFPNDDDPPQPPGVPKIKGGGVKAD
jgi:hypothetical protein